MCVCLYSTPLCYRTEKDKAPPSPHLIIYSDGLVHVKNDQVLVSTCRMHVYKFPFDIQSCNLSFKSVLHSGEPVTCCVLISSSLMCLPLFTFTVYCHLSTRHQITPHIPDIPSLLTSQFFISHISRRNTAWSLSQLFRGHRLVSRGDADPVRVGVHQHDSHQQNCWHVWLHTRCVDLQRKFYCIY